MYLTPMTRERSVAAEWLERFEGAGLDGVVAKPADATYEPGKRAMLKIKHARTADCVVAGFRWHKAVPDAVGSLLLGLYDDRGTLHHVGVTSSFTVAARKALVAELEPLGRTHSHRTRGDRGQRPKAAVSGCLVDRAAGAPERISRGNRCGSNGSVK